jgi:hypothetical protein
MNAFAHPSGAAGGQGSQQVLQVRRQAPRVCQLSQSPTNQTQNTGHLVPPCRSSTASMAGVAVLSGARSGPAPTAAAASRLRLNPTRMTRRPPRVLDTFPSEMATSRRERQTEAEIVGRSCWPWTLWRSRSVNDRSSLPKEKAGCWTPRRAFAQVSKVLISSYFRTSSSWTVITKLRQRNGSSSSNAASPVHSVPLS